MHFSLDIDMSDGVREMLRKPKRFLDKLKDLTAVLDDVQTLMFMHIERHFQEQRNYDGSVWAKMSQRTEMFRLLGIAQLGRVRKRNSKFGERGDFINQTKLADGVDPMTDQLIATKDYLLSVTRKSASPLSTFRGRGTKRYVKVATKAPASANEFDHTIAKGAWFAGAKVPHREVMFIDDEMLTDVIEELENFIFNTIEKTI